MLARHLSPALLDALSDRPVVFLHGARQAGKTTLVRSIAEDARPASYFTLDDAGVLAAARSDPAGFLAGIDGPVVLDEVQRAPEIFLALKASVDRKRSAGRYLLTGSTDALLLPQLSRLLVGRMEVLTLWPLSQGEIQGTAEGFVDALFGRQPPTLDGPAPKGDDIVSRILRGGYPEAAGMTSAERRRAWFASYVTTILQRDVRDLASVEGLHLFPRLLQLLATRPMAPLNVADLARNGGLSQSTLKRYLALLEATFMVRVLPPWFVNLGKRIAKAPKLLFSDTGLMSHLLGVDAQRLKRDHTLLGGLLENFVVMEVIKQAGWSRAKPAIYHFRAHGGEEVDIILEHPSGSLVGIEVKAGATVRGDQFKALKSFAQSMGKLFHRGVVLYMGQEIVPFGQRLHAVPVSALWRWGARAPRQAT